MMGKKTKVTQLSQINGDSGGGSSSGGSERSGGGGGDGDWEMRPGGMLVQKRNPNSDRAIPPPTIRVRVKYGSIYHQIHINSQASFGELKKMLSGPTGLHHLDQKLLYKDKERDSKSFLDIVGVKDRSKMVLVEDAISHEKRILEMRRNAKTDKSLKLISEISLEVDRLAGQVSALESVILKGVKVAEKDILIPMELLMNQLIRLDGIIADGDVKVQRKLQVKRIQKHVETLDMLKIKNSAPSSNGNHVTPQNQQQKYTNGKKSIPVQQEQEPLINLSQGQQKQQNDSGKDPLSGVVMTTKWETFDSATPTLMPKVTEFPSKFQVRDTVHSKTTSASPAVNPNRHKFNWELF